MSSRVILGTGRRAVRPYYVEKFYVNLYSVEELCFLLVDRAELLDGEFMGRELVRWLEEQCGLRDLARRLETLLSRKCSAAAFAGEILSYVAIYPEEVIRQTEDALRGSESLGPYEKLAAKADHLLREKRYLPALQQYQGLLLMLPEAEKNLRGRLCHNMGTACAGLFLYREAADCYRRAYEADGKREGLVLCLAALRMGQRERDYINYIGEHPEYHALSLEVERLMKRAEGSFEGSEENRMLVTCRMMKEEAGASYDEEIGKLVDGLKTQYRRCMR